MVHRVAVTGMSCMSSLGASYDIAFKRMLNGDSGIIQANLKNPDIKSRIWGAIPTGEGENEFNAASFAREYKRRDPFIVYARHVGSQAISHSGLLGHYDTERVGVYCGSGIGGLHFIHNSSIKLNDDQYKTLSPFFIPGSLINISASEIAIENGFHGPSMGIVTACASSAHAIGEAYKIVKYGLADSMIVIGSEAVLFDLGVALFDRLSALSRSYNDTPHIASRPWDRDRDGFVIAEGAGAIVIENYDMACKRNANILSEIKGYGINCDAYHITSPNPDGAMSVQCMQLALSDANIHADEIGFISAHATSTSGGDIAEANAMNKLFGKFRTPITSNKSSIGHSLGASGILEFIYGICALNSNIVPPTINVDNIDEQAQGLNIAKSPLEGNINNFISTSFGFGGQNAAIIAGKA